VEAEQSPSGLQQIALVLNDGKLACRVNLCETYNDIYQGTAGGIQELEKLKPKQRRKIIKATLAPWTYGGDAWTAGQDYHKTNMKFRKDMGSSDRLFFAHHMINRIRQALPTSDRFTGDWHELARIRFARTNSSENF
jgi:hypothetical protein